MRYLLQPVYALAFGLCIVAGPSNSYGGLTALVSQVMGNTDGLTSLGSTSSNTEVNGIRFEPVGPDQVVTIPPDEQYAGTPFKIGVHITNNTSTPLRFSPYRTLRPRIVGPDKQTIPWVGGGSDRGGLPVESDCPLIKNGESVTFWLKAGIIRVNHQLIITVAEKFGSFVQSAPLSLKPGTYQVYLEYKQPQTQETIAIIESGRLKFGTLNGFWIGHGMTSSVKFRIVQR